MFLYGFILLLRIGIICATGKVASHWKSDEMTDYLVSTARVPYKRAIDDCRATNGSLARLNITDGSLLFVRSHLKRTSALNSSFFVDNASQHGLGRLDNNKCLTTSPYVFSKRYCDYPLPYICQRSVASSGGIIMMIQALVPGKTWNAWTAWSKCDSECYVGNVRRFRLCVELGRGSDLCGNRDIDIQNKPCNVGFCPKSQLTETFSPCNASCGQRGMKRRYLTCNIDKLGVPRRCENATWVDCKITCAGPRVRNTTLNSSVWTLNPKKEYSNSRHADSIMVISIGAGVPAVLLTLVMAAFLVYKRRSRNVGQPAAAGSETLTASRNAFQLRKYPSSPTIETPSEATHDPAKTPEPHYDRLPARARPKVARGPRYVNVRDPLATPLSTHIPEAPESPFYEDMRGFDGLLLLTVPRPISDDERSYASVAEPASDVSSKDYDVACDVV